MFAHNGTELLYRNVANELVSVLFTADAAFRVVQERTLFSMEDYLISNGRPLYAVSPDDQEFVMLRISDQATDTELIWVENWAEELAQRASN